MGEIIKYQVNSHEASGYLAGTSGPGIIVIQEWWGLVDHIKDVCERFAKEGFVALAPDLYNGKTTKEPDEAAKEMMAMQLPEAVKTMSGAVDELAKRSSNPDKLGVTGFCMGGGLALLLAVKRPDKIAAVVPWYGVIPWPDAEVDYSKMNAAVLGHYAEKDGFLPPEKVKELETHLKALGKEAKLTVYKGVDHAFFNDDRPEVYNKEISEACWKETLEFFKNKLS
jgi:carboxymethylenebutenolidase